MKELITEIDQDIRGARASLARKKLLEIPSKKIPRESLAPLARLSWRADIPALGLKWLNPLVRPTTRRQVTITATDSETVEYSACLIRLGASTEALELLGKVNKESHPESMLYQVFALVTQWEYAKTIPLLREYADAVSSDHYQTVVAGINLALAFIFEGHLDEAKTELNRVGNLTEKNQMNLAMAKVMELRTQIAITEGEISKARDLIQEGKEALGDSKSLDEFFLRKWSAVADLKEHRRTGPIDKIREEALNRRHWETLRDCDRLQGIHLNQPSLLEKVYYGTPFLHYRERLLELWGEPHPPHDYYDQYGKQKALFDISEGRLGRRKLKVGRLMHQLLIVLASDIYRPKRLAELFGLLHPDDYYHPTLSPPRIYDLMARLRSWLKANRVPLKISYQKGAYSLYSSGGITLRLKHHVPKPDSSLNQKLRAAFPTEFSAKEAATSTGKPLRSIQRQLRMWEEQQLLISQGSGRARKYRWLPSS